MKKIAVLCTLMLALTTNSFALLPPLYQSITEIQGLLEAPEMSRTLQSGELIMAIERTESGFKVITNKHVVEVTIKTLPQNRPGPAQFEYIFGESKPIH